MAGFGGFGTGSTGGGLFGAKPPEQGSGGFAMPATTTVTTASGLTFGTPTFGTGATGGLFGAQTSTFGTGFGAKPGAATTSTGFTFGATPPNTSTPAFGAPAAAAPGFGVPATQTAPTFGVPSTQATPTFGALGTQPAPTLGAPTTQAAPTFGTLTTQATTGFGMSTTNTTTASTFGSLSSSSNTLWTSKTTAATGFTPPSTSTTAATATPLTFGLQAATTTGTTIPTTSTTTSTAPGLSFGIPAATATATSATTQATGFTLTQTSAAATTSGTTTTGTLSFGVPKTTGGLTFGTGTSGFGTTATTATTTPTFNFGTSVTTPSLGTGLLGTPKTAENVTVATSTTTTSAGLGGINYKQTSQGLSGQGNVEPKHAKDHALPNPILETLNEFQNFTKQQKSISVEISHSSSKPLKKVQEDTEAMESLLTMITSGLTRNAIAVDKLKTETAQGLHQAEMAQRNHETPPGLEYDNSASSDYFNDLVTKFETDTVRLRVQIEASEKHLRSLTQSSTISPQELTLAMRRLHETLIVLAARVQALHTAVQSQKEQYKNLRRVYFKDDINLFENDNDQNLVKKQTIYSLRSLTGPTPFSENPGVGPSLHVDGLAMLAGSTGASIPATSSNPSWMSPLNETGNTTSLLPGSSLLSGFQPLEIPGFQLSKPPTGNKRSRR